MNISETARGHLIAGAGGVVLIVSLFLEWTGARTGWQDFTVVDVLMMLIGAGAIVFALLPAIGAVETGPGLGLTVAAAAWAAFGFAAAVELEISGTIGVWLGVLGSAAIALGAYDATRPWMLHTAPRGPEPSAPASPSPGTRQV